MKEGVGALIVKNDHFLTIEELHLSRQTQKLPGMRSMVFETIEAGELKEEALLRALSVEEVLLGKLIKGFTLDSYPLCRILLNPGILLNAYLLLINIPNDYVLKIGTAKEEVANPGWNKMEDCLNEPVGSRRFRPGNREVILSYQKYLVSGREEDILYVNTIDRIPEEIFDLYEANQNILQSQSVHFA